VWRDVEFIQDGLDEKHYEEMGQDIGLGGSFVGGWRPVEADQAFQAFEGEFDAPTQAIEIGYIFV
jgi:hypothetical protein